MNDSISSADANTLISNNKSNACSSSNQEFTPTVLGAMVSLLDELLL